MGPVNTADDGAETELPTAPQAGEEVEDAAAPVAEEYYPVDYAISSYGADYPVDGLVKRIVAGSIFIPRFQRDYVWNGYRASRFIESLLLGLPVPAVFLYREPGTNKLLVIDGQQRLSTLKYFYTGVFAPTERAFRLRGVQERFEGRTYATLEEDDRLRLDDSIIHAIVVKQDDPHEEHEDGGPSSIYHIFERLNTGGVLLQPQEIRSCIYHGRLIELLGRLNESPPWRALFGAVSARMRDRELILRFLALYHRPGQYRRPMKEFLNHFAAANRMLNDRTANEYSELFTGAIGAVHDWIGVRAFRTARAVNAALFDAVMVGVARRLATGPVADSAQIRDRYESLLTDPRFRAAISSGTTDEASVADRLGLATAAFAGAP